MAVQQENKRLFSAHIEELGNSLYFVALRLTRNEADAQDLVAESVIKAWRSFATLEDKERFRPWIFRILRNHFISDYRKNAVRPDTVSLSEPEGMSGPEEVTELLISQSDAFLSWWGNPEREFVNSLLAEHIERAIDNLPEVFRSVIVLINLEGLSYDEAAEVLEVPPGTVRSRMRRGRTLLQTMLWEQAKEAGLVVTEQQETGND